MSNPTAADLRAQAAEAECRAMESFERSDTDGFLSQWASGMTSRRLRLQADIAENGGRAQFPALFDLEGNLVAAKLITTQYGPSWGILASDDPFSQIIKWVNAFPVRKSTMIRKGYTEGIVLAPAKAVVTGSGHGLSGAMSAYVATERTDGGFSRDVEIVSVCRKYEK